MFRLDPYVGKKAKPVPYRRRDYYKIMLVIGNSKVHYADKVVEVKKQALTFSNPFIPYKWEDTTNIKSGVFCIFDDEFFHQHGDLHQNSVFQPGGSHIFELTDEQVINVSSVAGHKVGPGSTVYAATKHAVRTISEGLRQEVKPYNLRTTIISPGAVDTELPSSVGDPDTAEGIKEFYDDMAIPADSFARSVAFVISQPEEMDVNEILYRPTSQEL